MIPVQWAAARRSLLILQHAQSKDNYVWSKDEVAVTDEHYAALAATPITPDEVTELATGVRGQYQLGDTRGFVETQEVACARYNCWMVRGADGAPTYHSEPVTGTVA